MADPALSAFMSRWRRIVLGGRVVLEGVVHEAHAAPSQALAAALKQTAGLHYWRRRRDELWLVQVEESRRPTQRWSLHALLLIATLATTSLAGSALVAGQSNNVPFWMQMKDGMSFALPLLAILGAHEGGHYIVARRYRVDTTLPFFIPFWPAWNLIGTLGAFIRIRSPIFDRRTLFDIGAAGPVAGLAIAVPCLVVGLARSVVTPDSEAPAFARQFILLGGDRIFLADSPLLHLLRAVVAPSGVLWLHPLAAAGWIGIFFTMLNLLPLAQFDGGHVLFAMIGPRQIWSARATFLALLLLGLRWPGWWVWAVLALIVGRGTLTHPKLVSADQPLDRGRLVCGVLIVALFALCFMPLPIWIA